MSAENIFHSETGKRIAPISWSRFEVPSNWEVIKAKDLFTLQSGNNFSSEDMNDEGEGYPLIKIGSVEDMSISEYIDKEFDNRYIVEPGEYIIKMSGAGDFRCKKWKGEQAALNQRVCKLDDILVQDVLYDYVGIVLDIIVQQIDKSLTGTTFSNMSQGDIYKSNIPVPPLREQREIVSLLSDVDEYISLAHQRLEHLQQAKQATLQRVFERNEVDKTGDPTQQPKTMNTNIFNSDTGDRIAPAVWSRFESPEGWNLKNLEESCEIQSGFGFSSDYFNSDSQGVPLIKRSTVNGTDNLSTYTTEEFEDRYIITEGDVLISMDGNFEVKIWDGPKSALNQRVCRVKSVDDEILDTYLGYILEPIIDQCEVATAGTTVSSLSMSQLNKINIPVPPLREQREIISLLSDIDENIQYTREDLESAFELKDGLLQGIFS